MHWLLLALIVAGAGGLRFTDLDGRPAGFFRDEAEKGYNAWALAVSGGMLELAPPSPGRPRAAWRAWPWMTNIFGNRTSAIYQYVDAPFQPSDGPTVAATRRAAALAGTLTVALLGALLMRAWGVWAGLAAAAWLALCPWHLVFSRWALEGIFVPLLMAVVLWGLWGLEQERRWGLPLTGAGLGWLFYAYSGAQPLVLAWGVCLAVLYRRRLWTREALRSPGFWLAVGLFLLPVVPTLAVRLAPGGSERLTRVAIWNRPETAAWQVPLIFLRNYLLHLDPRFLFFAGDAQPRHCVPGMGQMTLLDAVLLPAGLFWTLRRREPLAGALLAAWLCGPIPAALTSEGLPHALRAIGMLPSSAAFGGYAIAAGAAWLSERLQRGGARPARARVLIGLLLVGLFAVAASGVERYWRLYGGAPIVQVAFENGQRRAWERLARERKPDQRVIGDRFQPYSVYYQLFFLRVPPRSVGPAGPDPEHFIHYDPQRQTLADVRAHLRPGDWLLFPVDPIALTDPAGQPWIDHDPARRAGEVWIVIERTQ
jgi:4-amino-4-deoxy-L-arabinose transferase-like glycosyltransferase